LLCLILHPLCDGSTPSSAPSLFQREKKRNNKKKLKLKLKKTTLDHATDKAVDLSLTVAVITTLDEGNTLLLETTTRAVQLEGPEEAVGLLEVRTNSEDLVNKILHADDAIAAKSLLDHVVADKRDALVVDLTGTALVDHLADSLEVGITVGDVGADKTEHGDGSLVETDKDSVEDLTETEETKDLTSARRSLVDTTDTHDKSKTGLGLTEEITVETSNATLLNEVTLSLLVLFVVLLSALEDHFALGFLCLSLLFFCLLLTFGILCVLGILSLKTLRGCGLSVHFYSKYNKTNKHKN